MSYSPKQVGPNRFRENIGRYFEEFEVGHIYEHRPGRTISEADNTWFTLLTMNTHPLHFDFDDRRVTNCRRERGGSRRKSAQVEKRSEGPAQTQFATHRG
jgi:hypothetical protein